MEKPPKYEGKIADFHADLLNPQLNKILQSSEFNHALNRAEQLTPEGLMLIDLIFASVYRRINEDQKKLAVRGSRKDQQAVFADHRKIIQYYKDTDAFRVIERPEDLNLKMSDKPNIVLHLECGDIITGPKVVEELYRRGIRSMGPMYNHDNQIGGGSQGNIKRGLTPLGKRIIDRMVELGMIIDFSHANRKTTQDILERVGNYNKVAATHAGIGEKERFLTPDLLRQIAARGGVVGLTLAKPFFPSLKEYAEGMKMASDLINSADNLAIGTDFGGFDIKDLYEEIDGIGKLSRVAEILSEKGGFSDEDIAKIMYGNIARLVKQLR